ncbi:Protein NRT1/ PTR FAMILY 8.1 [Chlorella vulgaris]
MAATTAGELAAQQAVAAGLATRAAIPPCQHSTLIPPVPIVTWQGTLSLTVTPMFGCSTARPPQHVHVSHSTARVSQRNALGWRRDRRVVCSARPDSPFDSLDRAIQVINRVIALGERAKWGSDDAGRTTSESASDASASSAAPAPLRWVQFGAVYSCRLAVDQPMASRTTAVASSASNDPASSGGSSCTSSGNSGGRQLRDYLALPIDQYSLLDPKWISREEGGLFKFSLPLQDLVNVDMQPEIFISVLPEPQQRRVTLVGTRAALGSPEIDEAFKLNVSAAISQQQRRRLPHLPRPPSHLPGRPVFRLRRWAAAARGRTWPPPDAAGKAGQPAAAPGAAAAAAAPRDAGGATAYLNGGSSSSSSSSSNSFGSRSAGAGSVGEGAGELSVRQGDAAVTLAAAAAVDGAPFPEQHVYISHDSNDDDEYADSELEAAELAVAELAVAELDSEIGTLAATSPAASSSIDRLDLAVEADIQDAAPMSGIGSIGRQQQQQQAQQQQAQGRQASLHCRTQVTMAVRVPRALKVVPSALLGYAGSLLLRTVLAATLPNFLNLLAADYRRWAGLAGTSDGDGDGGGSGSGRQLDAPVGELFADAAATVREGREWRAQHRQDEELAAVEEEAAARATAGRPGRSLKKLEIDECMRITLHNSTVCSLEQSIMKAQDARTASPFASELDTRSSGSDAAKEDGKSALHEKAGTGSHDDEELSILRSPMVTRAPFILVTEFCERLTYYGIATNIITYLTGVLGMSNSSAASAVNAWSGTCYLTPLLGAFLADAYWGRYWTILIFSLLYVSGLAGLSASAGDDSLHPAPGADATSGQLAFFWAFMYLIAVGTGGIKPCVSTFGADQFDENKPGEARLVPRFFNWFYGAINLGAIISATVVVNVQSKDWFAGFLIPTCAFAVAIVVFTSGSKLYRHVSPAASWPNQLWESNRHPWRMPPAGSPFTRMAKVLCGAIAHRKAQVPEDAVQLHEVEGHMSIVPGQVKLERTPSCKWLEKSCVRTKAPGAPDRWLVTLTEVEELKAVVRLLPIMLTLIVYNAVYAQMTTLFILQGEWMDTALGSINVAPATVSVLDSISVILWVVLYDLLIQPYFARKGRPISLLVRIGIGYLIAVLAMVAAAVVEVVRLGVVDRNGLQDESPTAPGAPVVPMSVWWQIPQYFLIGCSEVFAMVGSLELFYSQAPDAMRSTCSALQLIATALGSYLASLLVIIVQDISNGSWVPDNVNDGHMDYFFIMMAVLMLLTCIVYIWVARRFRYKNVKHTTVDPEALALAPDGRGALSFSAGIVRTLSVDISDGMHRQDSLELQHALSSGRLSSGMSKRASAFLGLEQQLKAVPEEPFGFADPAAQAAADGGAGAGEAAAATATSQVVAAAEEVAASEGVISNAQAATLLSDERVESNDLIAGVYEGGFKSWEGGVDLSQFLAAALDHQQQRQQQSTTSLQQKDEARAVQQREVEEERREEEGREQEGAALPAVALSSGSRVIELGCGHGLPGLVALRAGAEVHFQDYNRSVLTTLTIPNVEANSGAWTTLHSSGGAAAADAADGPDASNSNTDAAHPPGPAPNRNAAAPRARYFSGSWDALPAELERLDLQHTYDLVLTAETIYSVEAMGSLFRCIKACLRPETGVAYIAAKSYYFGVGGGTAAFRQLVQQDGGYSCRAVAVVDDGLSNKREVLELAPLQPQ